MTDVTIKVRRDGPYKVCGPAAVHDAAGRPVAVSAEDAVVVLCRCGRSATPPRCDASHRRPP